MQMDLPSGSEVLAARWPSKESHSGSAKRSRADLLLLPVPAAEPSD